VHQFISNYVSSLYLRRLQGCCEIFGIILFFIVYSPLISLATIITLLLALLIPFGFIFGWIEHRFVLIWALFVLFVQLGGVLDLSTDVLLLAQVMTHVSSYKEILHLGSEREEQLHLGRVLLTLVPSGAAVITVILLNRGSMGVLLDKMSATSFWQKPPKPEAKKYSRRKKRSCFTSLLKYPPLPLLVLYAIIWKIILVGLRVYLLVIVFLDIIRRGHLEKKVQRRVQWLELVLFVDLVWSGIPLGILTVMELHEEEFHLGEDQLLELMKLGALMVDIVGASFLFWFILVGLIKKTRLHHEEHDVQHVQHEIVKAEKEPLLNINDVD